MTNLYLFAATIMGLLKLVIDTIIVFIVLFLFYQVTGINILKNFYRFVAKL
jgi:hypothetical protein